MEIDFIKWMCEKAEGFNIVKNRLRISGEKTFTECLLGYFDYAHVYYPLLLQRAIEGVNKEDSCFLIMQNHRGIYFDTYKNPAVYKDYTSIDKAKKSALKYIYEQDTKLRITGSAILGESIIDILEKDKE